MKKFVEWLKENDYYKAWFKDAWPYVTGAVLLSVFQIVTFATTGSPWGVSGVFANWGAWIIEAFGGSVDNRELAQETCQGRMRRSPHRHQVSAPSLVRFPHAPGTSRSVASCVRRTRRSVRWFTEEGRSSLARSLA